MHFEEQAILIDTFQHNSAESFYISMIKIK